MKKLKNAVMWFNYCKKKHFFAIKINKKKKEKL